MLNVLLGTCAGAALVGVCVLAYGVTRAVTPRAVTDVDFHSGRARLSVVLDAQGPIRLLARAVVESPSAERPSLDGLFGSCRTATSPWTHFVPRVGSYFSVLELATDHVFSAVDLLTWQEELAKTCRRKRLVLRVSHGPSWLPTWFDQTHRYKLAELLQGNSAC
jgi:hypothetical protein